jgi:hypothetical protein
MFRVALRRRHCRLAPVLAFGMLASGCASLVSAPLVLGSTYRSIKDDQVEELAAPATPKVRPRVTAPVPPKRRVVARPASGPPADQPICEGESACMVRLKALIESPDRSWIGEPEPPGDHATGTRLFAYRALQGRLSCAELSRAIEDLETAAATFRTPVAGIDAGKARRVRALNGAVETELRAERTRRCSG